MGMSSYIIDLEDKFQYTDIPKIISQSETVEEAIKKADEHRKKEFDSYPFRIVECNFSTLKSLGF